MPVARPAVRRRPGLALAGLVAVVALAGACSGDDGADVRSSGTGSGSGSGSGTGAGSGSGSGSGTGLSQGEVAGSSNNPLVNEATEQYANYVEEQVGQLVNAARAFTDAVRSGDIEGAKAEFAPSRQAWERIEP